MPCWLMERGWKSYQFLLPFHGCSSQIGPIKDAIPKSIDNCEEQVHLTAEYQKIESTLDRFDRDTKKEKDDIKKIEEELKRNGI